MTYFSFQCVSIFKGDLLWCLFVSLQEFQSFTDLEFSKERTITCIDWHPTIKGVVAVSVGERLPFDDRVDNAHRIIMTPSLILIWSFSDPIHPQVYVNYMMNPRVYAKWQFGMVCKWVLNELTYSRQRGLTYSSWNYFSVVDALDHVPTREHAWVHPRSY